MDQCPPGFFGVCFIATVEDGVRTGRSSPMTIEGGNQGHGLANNLPLQLGLVAVLAAILIALAALYVW